MFFEVGWFVFLWCQATNLKQHGISFLCTLVWASPSPNKNIYLNNHNAIITANKSFNNSLISWIPSLYSDFPNYLPTNFFFNSWFGKIKIKIRSRYFMFFFFLSFLSLFYTKIIPSPLLSVLFFFFFFHAKDLLKKQGYLSCTISHTLDLTDYFLMVSFNFSYILLFGFT